MASCWFNGKIIPIEQAKVSVFDHGLLYGDGIFEGIRFYNHKGFHVDEHLQRLFDSAQAIGLQSPYSKDALAKAIKATIRDYGEADGYLRVVITRGEGPLGLDPRKCPSPNTFILADQLTLVEPAVKEKGLRLIIAATRRLPVDGLDPRIKSLNYLNHMLARMEANNAQADEAILLNQQGHVTEGSTDNLFIVKRNRLLTPPTCDGALDGVTRRLVIKLARECGMACEEISLAPYDLYTADECFITGTAVELIPAREIDGRQLPQCPGPVFQKLQDAFTRYIKQHNKDTSQQAVAS